MKKYDLIVIGGGPGGYVAAVEAGKCGKSVLLVEERHVGGVCLNEGCIPTKTLLHTSKYYQHLRENDVKGVVASSMQLDWEAALAWKDKVVLTYRKAVEGQLRSARVEVLNARAQFIDRSTLEIGGERYSGQAIIIATGSRPAMPPIPGLEQAPGVVTSTGILELKRLPKRLAVIGAGVIGLEIGAMYAQLGAQVDVVEMLPDALPFMEPDLSKGLLRALTSMRFQFDAKVVSVERESDTESALIVVPNHGGPEAAQRIVADTVLVATGRRANIENLGLETAGVKTAKGCILVNERMETSAPRVFAIGDVVGKSLFAHSASRMAEVAAKVICGDRTAAMLYNAIPWAIYTWPEAAGCGLTEAEAVAAGHQTIAAQLPMRQSARFYAEQEEQPGMIKIVADANDGVILGVHMLGAGCSEMIWGAAMAIHLGLTVEAAAQTIFPHPTVGEVLRDVLLRLVAKREKHA
jgi:dihydrolipoamide dehydrogenase